MHFHISREALLKPLLWVLGAVDRRSPLPVLANIRVSVQEGVLTLCGTDLEMEMRASIPLDEIHEFGETTLPARKWADICRALPEGAMIKCEMSDNACQLTSGRSRFRLAMLPPTEFPAFDLPKGAPTFAVLPADFRRILQNTQFAMGSQDVRHVLNGLWLESTDNQLCAVGTDGHRLSYSALSLAGIPKVQWLLPRKAVLELSRLLSEITDPLTVSVADRSVHIATTGCTFSSKLIDGRFPDYQHILSRGERSILTVDRDVLRATLQRVAILSGEKYRHVLMRVQENMLIVTTDNTEHERAEEELAVAYIGPAVEMVFNVTYLLDVLGVLPQGEVELLLRDSSSSLLIQSQAEANSVFVVMPLRI